MDELRRGIYHGDVQFVTHLLEEYGKECIYPCCIFGTSPAIIELLIPFVDLEERNLNGYTALQYAYFSKQYGVARLLLEHGASPVNTLKMVYDAHIIPMIAPFVPAEEVNRRIDKLIRFDYRWTDDIIEALIPYCTEPLLINECKTVEIARLFVPLITDWSEVTIQERFPEFILNGALVTTIKATNKYVIECRVRLLFCLI